MVVAQSCPTLCNPGTVARQAPPSMEFFRQEDWSGWPFPPPRDLPDPGVKRVSPEWVLMIYSQQIQYTMEKGQSLQ